MADNNYGNKGIHKAQSKSFSVQAAARLHPQLLE